MADHNDHLTRMDDLIRRQDDTLARITATQASLHALTQEWDRKQAAGEILSLPDLTRRLKDVEAGLYELRQEWRRMVPVFLDRIKGLEARIATLEHRKRGTNGWET